MSKEIISDIHKAIELIEKCKDDFDLKDVCYDEEHYDYCMRYFNESVYYLDGIVHYMRGE